MPNKRNAKKALRQSIKRATRNTLVKDTFKKAVKTVNKALAAGTTEVKEQLRLAQQALDKAAKRGIIKKGNASRKMSRLTKRVTKAIKK